MRHSRVPQGADAVFKMFVADKMDALAGLRPQLEIYREKLPGSRILEGRFTVVQQAAGTPKGHAVGARYLAEFIEDVKASGLVVRTIAKNGVRGLSVAPAVKP